MTSTELGSLVEEMCRLNKQGKYIPILEADLGAFLYHLLLAKAACQLSEVHLETRVLGSADRNERFDLVVGSVEWRNDGRPAVRPRTIVEIKMFPRGFTDQQHRVHFQHVLEDDLRKLAGVQTREATRIEFLFDEVGYLAGKYQGHSREEVIVAKRDEIAEGAALLFARRVREDWEIRTR